MLDWLDPLWALKAYVISLSVSALSALVFLNLRIPLLFVRIHVFFFGIPVLVTFMALITTRESIIWGPWCLDSLSWLMAFLVLTISYVVQRYSVRYLMGDRYYRRYFVLLTFTTGVASVAWLMDDLRWFLLFWGLTLIGLTWLIGINRAWEVARSTALFAGRVFAYSWLALLIAIFWLAYATGKWQLSLALVSEAMAQLDSWERTGINLLLILAVIIPAAQWPFQRWLLESVTSPTPVSALMHAGLVNAGGILLTRFAPLLNGDIAQIFLLVLASISILLGTGILLVHVDYKRQLVASTIAQMGFMLMQCALGAYIAAIIHLVLHALFKAGLFLQAGSALRFCKPSRQLKLRSLFWEMIFGCVISFSVGLCFWMFTGGSGYQLISSVILGLSLSLTGVRLISFGQGTIGRAISFALFGGVVMLFGISYYSIWLVLDGTVYEGAQASISISLIILLTLLFCSAWAVWLMRHRNTSTLSARLYLWLVKLGEPKSESVETSPRYLEQYPLRGGNQYGCNSNSISK